MAFQSEKPTQRHCFSVPAARGVTPDSFGAASGWKPQYQELVVASALLVPVALVPRANLVLMARVASAPGCSIRENRSPRPAEYQNRGIVRLDSAPGTGLYYLACCGSYLESSSLDAFRR